MRAFAPQLLLAVQSLVGCTVASQLSVRDNTNSSSPVSVQLPLKSYGDHPNNVYHRRIVSLDAPRARAAIFPSGSTILKNGTIRREGALALSCDIILERNVPLKLRDGVTMYTNIFRPTGNGTYPVIFGWSPYGNDIGGQWLDDIANRSGVPLSRVSEFQRFEGADPAYWVDKGYVVLSPDPRGIGLSEGNFQYWGRTLAEDGYDFIEWAAKQCWSNGKVAMTGNSFLGVSQWFIAAGQPPSLAAIAPWEGLTDHYRDIGNRGGIPAVSFADSVLQTFSGRALVEDTPKMIVEEQTVTQYWQDKIACLEKIEVPAYVVASYTNFGHAHGTFAGYRQIASMEKWLRVHNTQEWEDYYTAEYVEDLRRFFDNYLKGVDNGWETTPRVRLSVLNPGGEDIVNRVEEEFPLARTEYTPLFLIPSQNNLSNGTLEFVPSTKQVSLSYNVTGSSSITFTKNFDEDTEITGYMSLRIWAEAHGSSDMELKITVTKLDSAGNAFVQDFKNTISAQGYQRASLRELDDKLSTPSEPYLLATNEKLLEEGQIVPLDINIWPMGMLYKKGQTLQLSIAEQDSSSAGPDDGYGIAAVPIAADGGSYYPRTNATILTLGGTAELPQYVKQQVVTPPASRNKGKHIFHFGGGYESRLLIPVIPN